MSMTDGKMPPNNRFAEEYVIGAVLCAPDCLPMVHSVIGDNSFYLERHRQIFDALLDLRDLGRDITLDACVTRLQERGTGHEDDLAFLLGLSSDLLGATKAAENAVSSAKLVKRCSLQRQRQRLAQEMIEKPDLDREKITVELEEITAELLSLDGGQARDPWAGQLFTVEDALKPRPAPVELIAGTIRTGSLILWGGEPDTLKSFLLKDAFVSLSLGKAWLPGENGQGGRATVKTRALWLDADNGLSRLHGRTEALCRAYDGDPHDSLFQYASFLNPPVNLAKARSGQMLIDCIKHHKVGIVALDNLKSFSGASDENSGEMAVILAVLRWVVETTGATLCIVHHTVKSSEGKSLKSLFRGHGSILAAVDYAFLLQREPDSDVVTVQTAKSRDVIVPPFAARFWCEHKLGGSEMLKAGFCETLYGEADSEIEIAVMQAVPATRSIGLRELSAKVRSLGVKARQTRISEAVRRMGQAGRLIVSPGNRGSLKISL